MLTVSEIKKALGIPPSIPEFTMTGDEEVPKEEEWVWIEGYKGTNANMMCRDQQYEMNKIFVMPEDATIKECVSGFHLCYKLNDVYRYYDVRYNNRFFKVRALVRKKDADSMAERYGDAKSSNPFHIYSMYFYDSKLVAKSIEFIEELTVDEILNASVGNLATEWTDEDKQDALKHGVDHVKEKHEKIEAEKRRQTLIDTGYSLPFADWLIGEDKYDIAYAVGTQTDLSMDMKVLTILHGDLDN